MKSNGKSRFLDSNPNAVLASCMTLVKNICLGLANLGQRNHWQSFFSPSENIQNIKPVTCCQPVLGQGQQSSSNNLLPVTSIGHKSAFRILLLAEMNELLLYLACSVILLGEIRKAKYEKEKRGKIVPWQPVEITFGPSFHINKRKEPKEVIAECHSQV